MPQDAFTLSYIAAELKDKLLGGKISRIIQPSRDELTFIIYTAKGNVKLESCLSAQAARLNISSTDSPVPAQAPNFCMLLRKHLQNAQITDIVQPDFERIIYFDFKCVSDFSSTSMRLYFELMGKYSNAVLTENGVITGALKTTSIGENTRRVLFGGVKYVAPEPQDKISPLDNQALVKLFDGVSGDRVKFISEHVKGISYATALEMVERYGENITAENVINYVTDKNVSPCVIMRGGEPVDFAVRSLSPSRKQYGSLLEAQSAYYSYIIEKKKFNLMKTRLESAVSSAVKKVEKRLAIIRDKIKECENADEIKLKGELLTANIYAVKKGMTCFKAINYYDAECGEITIDLDRTLSPSQNAQKYYKKYAKLKRTLASVSVQRQEAEDKLDYFNSISAHISSAENIADLAETEDELAQLGLIKTNVNVKKKPAPAPYRTYDCCGYRIIAGRNNLQNERLTKGLSPDDMWLHTQKYHSTHVGIITSGRDVPDKVLLTAAEICAYYSDGRAGSKIPVDYTRKKFVKKPPKSNAGFVVYTDYSTLLAEPDAHTDLCEKDETK